MSDINKGKLVSQMDENSSTSECVVTRSDDTRKHQDKGNVGKREVVGVDTRAEANGAKEKEHLAGVNLDTGNTQCREAPQDEQVGVNVQSQIPVKNEEEQNDKLSHCDNTVNNKNNQNEQISQVVIIEKNGEKQEYSKVENTVENRDEKNTEILEGANTGENKDKQKENVETPVARKEIRNTVVLAISFLCVFTSYTSIQNLQGSLNDEGGLGVLSLSCLYGANIVFCIVAPLIVRRLGAKRVIVTAFCVHLIYAACNFYPSFATLVPSSLLLGAVTGPLWTSQGIYLTTCAFSYAQETGTEVFTALSRINGIFYAVSDFNKIIGNLVSSFVLYQSKYNITRTNQSYCGISDCPIAGIADVIGDPEPVVVYTLIGIFAGCVLGGILTILIFLTPLQTGSNIKNLSVEDLFFPLFKMIARTDMKYLLPLTIYLAMAEEIVFAEVTKSYVSCPIGIQNVGYVMTVYGVSISVSDFVFSRLAKYTTRYVLFGLAAATHTALLVWIFNWIPTEEDTILIYVLITIWGLADGLWKTQYNSLLGKHFADDIGIVFSAAEGVKAIGFTATFVYSSLLCMHVKLSLAITFLAVGMLLYSFVEIRFIRNTRSEDIEMSEKQK